MIFGYKNISVDEKDQNEAPQEMEMEEEEENDDEEKESPPADTELTDKDRLQQAKGASNLLDDPKFNKTLEVLENSLLILRF